MPLRDESFLALGVGEAPLMYQLVALAGEGVRMYQ